MVARLYFLRRHGPKAFVICGDDFGKRFNVVLGPQTCTCNKTLCIHLLFVMLRVLKLDPKSPQVIAKSLQNFEVDSLLRSFEASRVPWPVGGAATTSTPSTSAAPHQQQQLVQSAVGSAPTEAHRSNPKHNEDTECPICLLRVLEGESIFKCMSCHHGAHLHCVNLWSSSQRGAGERVTCPLCRQPWDEQNLETAPLKSSSFPTQQSDLQQGSSSGMLVPLPHAPPIAADLLAQARPLIAVFGEELVTCFYAPLWSTREAALRRVRAVLQMKLQQSADAPDTIATTSTVLSMLEISCNDKIRSVYMYALDFLAFIVAVSTADIKPSLQPVVAAILAYCGDANELKRFYCCCD